MTKLLQNYTEVFLTLSNELVCISDSKGYFLEMSPAWNGLLGYTTQELMARPFIEFVHPDDLNRTLGAVKTLTDHGEILSFNNRYLKKCGGYVWLRWNAVEKDGMWISSARDISKEMESNILINELQRAAEIGSWRLHVGTMLVEWSDEIYHIHKIPVGTPMQKIDVISYYTSESRPVIENALKNAIEKGLPFDLELSFVDAEGNSKWVRSIGRPVIENSQCVRVIGVFQDITSLVNQRLEIEAKSKQLLESQKMAKLGFWHFDLTTQEIVWTEPMYNIFPERLENGPPSFERHRSTIHKDDVEMWERIVTNCVQDGKPYSMRFRTRDHNGRVVWVEARGEGKSDLQGRVISLFGTCQDVTENVLYEQGLKASLIKVKELSDAKSMFMANMSHEIRTPLNGIVGVVELLKDEISDPQHTELLDILISASDNLTILINDILDYSKLESGRMTITKELVSPKKIVSEVLSLFKPQTLHKALDVETEFACEDNYLLDGTRYRQVVMNLIGNAVKFTDNGFIKVSLMIEDRYLVTVVDDSGIGIHPDIQLKLFESFQQGDQGITKKYGGTGLGLAICKKIIELMHGWIEVNSTPGEGSSFKVKIPI